MMSSNRNLLVLFKSASLDERALEQELECINEILEVTGTPHQFCTANELVDRNRISSNPKRIVKEARFNPLRAFRFLINKN